jgi:hypothetical protein
MELEIITPKKEKNFEPVTIQLTIQTPEELCNAAGGSELRRTQYLFVRI